MTSMIWGASSVMTVNVGVGGKKKMPPGLLRRRAAEAAACSSAPSTNAAIRKESVRTGQKR